MYTFTVYLLWLVDSLTRIGIGSYIPYRDHSLGRCGVEALPMCRSPHWYIMFVVRLYVKYLVSISHLTTNISCTTYTTHVTRPKLEQTKLGALSCLEDLDLFFLLNLFKIVAVSLMAEGRELGG